MARRVRMAEVGHWHRGGGRADGGDPPEAGGTFLDTANCYGQWHGDAGESERVIGRWLRSRGKRNQMVIASKVGAGTTVPGDPDSRHWQGLSAPVIKEDAETSLRNLGVDRLDLYYAHIDDRDTPLDETVGALAEVAESGKAACSARATPPPGGSSGRGTSLCPRIGPRTAACSRRAAT